MLDKKQLTSIVLTLQSGGTIAYPTEAVYGLGCDPRNEIAIQKVLSLKKRSPEKGLILIGHDWQLFSNWIEPIPAERLEIILKTWPGPFTWIFPARKNISPILTGKFNSLAIRVTHHPIAKTICEAFDHPIVSTSLNLDSEPPIKSFEQAILQFDKKIDVIVPGDIGNQQNPSKIRDALTGKVFRE